MVFVPLEMLLDNAETLITLRYVFGAYLTEILRLGVLTMGHCLL